MVRATLVRVAVEFGCADGISGEDAMSPVIGQAYDFSRSRGPCGPWQETASTVEFANQSGRRVPPHLRGRSVAPPANFRGGYAVPGTPDSEAVMV